MGSSTSNEVQSPYQRADPSEIDLNLNGTRQSSLVKQTENIHESRKGQTDLLKKMFYKLDPSVIKGNVDAEYGQVKLGIKYVSSQQLLLVKVHEARRLTAVDIRGHISQPYVKVDLVQTATDQSTNIQEFPENEPKYTGYAHQTDKLVFNEIFSFKIPQELLEFIKLRCSVWSSDGSDQEEFLGEVHFDITQLDCVDDIQTLWHNLHSQTDLSIGGELNLHLGFKLPQSLNVTINNARKIGKINDGGKYPSALTVKVVLPGVPHVFKTTPVRGRDEYTWIENFTFPVPREELTSRHLICIVSDAKEEDSYLGECHIDLDSIDLFRGYEGTFRLSDMRGSDVVRSRWSCNAVTQELQEALYAHSVYMRPEFLFRPNSSESKVVSVSVPRAFVHSQMRVVNGVVVQ